MDFEQGVNFAIKQVRERALADHPVYIQTVPKRGYRFPAPITTVSSDRPEPAPLPTRRSKGAMGEYR